MSEFPKTVAEPREVGTDPCALAFGRHPKTHRIVMPCNLASPIIPLTFTTVGL